jgi:phospholipase/lecithinase/hemolysin
MKKVHGFVLVLASVLALIAEPATLEAQAPKYDAFFTFGDSLSDTGNLWLLTKAVGQDPAIPPSVSPHMTYFQGRFSNGPVAFEYLWDLMTSNTGGDVTPFLSTLRVPQKGAVSFAFGASGTGLIEPVPGSLFVPGLNGQVELFRAGLRGRKSPPRALYAIFSGANDYLAASADNPPVPSVVVGNIVNAVQKLYALGARDVMVLNLPDLGLIPLVPGELKGTLSGVTILHNLLLAEALTVLAASLPDLRLIPVDVYSFTQDLAAKSDLTPALPLAASYCLFTNPASCPDVRTFDVGSQYFFWDAEHPTTATHAALGAFLYSQLGQE